jgi:RNA-directed DNA polymerase
LPECGPRERDNKQVTGEGVAYMSDAVALAKLFGVPPQHLKPLLDGTGIEYCSYRRRKKSGKHRVIDIPSEALATWQGKVKDHILNRVPLLPCATGGVPGHSAKTNAAPHVRKSVVFSIDLEDFYPSVSETRVRQLFQSLGFSGSSLELLVSTTTHHGRLPQGTHTSPRLANLAAYSLDRRLLSLAREHGFAYTRYVDDITLSGPPKLLRFQNLIKRIVGQEGFKINVLKTTRMPSSGRQTVTGIVVNTKTNGDRIVRREVRKRAKAELAAAGELSDSTRGKIAWLKYLNPSFSNDLAQAARKAKEGAKRAVVA